jgi:RNA polymerase sigma factor (sigma-70 family)
MPRVATPSLVRQIESLFDSGSVVGLTDRQLLERFNAARGSDAEAAFAALVARHGPMILKVCLQLLRDQQHAEDAFQAVFLVLARRANSIHDPDKLANWLYGTALRTARCVKPQIKRRLEREGGQLMNPATSARIIEPVSELTSPEQTVLDREQAEMLHDEIERLPQNFRLPIILCYFDGLSLDQAANQLRWPEGTLRSRLARAREKLRRGLMRRGFALSSAGLLGVLGSRNASACVTPQLCDITARAAMLFVTEKAVGGVLSASAAVIAGEVIGAMIIHKIRLSALMVFALGLTACGAGVLGHSFGVFAKGPDASENRSPVAVVPQPAKANEDRPGPGRMFVVGRVLDPHGKPVSNASVMVHSRSKMRKVGSRFEIARIPMGHADSDEVGRFRVDSPRGSSSQHEDFAAVALAPGYGVGWVDLDPDSEQPSADITLQPEQVIQGRLFDLQGRPAGGVTVSVAAVRRIHYRGSDALSRRVEGVIFSWDRANVLEAWPKPQSTDNEGRFTLHGVGRGLKANLTLIDPRYAVRMIEVDTDDPSNVKSVTMALQPAKIITGRVTYADTGMPAPGAPVSIGAISSGSSATRFMSFETDANGRFRANPSPGDRFSMAVYAPEGTPYLTANPPAITWPKGAIEHSVDVALPRGALIHGNVTEVGSGKAVAGANVSFVPYAHTGVSRASETAADGSFAVAARPGPGHLIILATSDDYQLREIGDRMIREGKPGGGRLYSHAFIPCEPKPGANSLEINVALQPGMTVKGRIFGPHGQPVQDVSILSHVAANDLAQVYREWRGYVHPHSRNGHFQLHGLDAETEVSASFLEPRLKLGATVKVSGKLAKNGPIDVRLEPCGRARARLIDTDGKPITGFHNASMISMVIVPGPSRTSRDQADEGRLQSIGDRLSRIDPLNYEKDPVSDTQGQIVFPALIPGATYRIQDRTAIRSPAGIPTRKEFTVKPGETLDLGDILIEKPAP